MRPANRSPKLALNIQTALVWIRAAGGGKSRKLCLLLVLLLALISIAPAAAQTNIWSASMTPGQATSSGYCPAASLLGGCGGGIGSLTDDDFRLGSTTYTVEGLAFSPPDSVVAVLLDAPVPASQIEGLSLQIGSNTYGFPANINVVYSGGQGYYAWNESSAPWTVGTPVRICLGPPCTTTTTTTTSRGSSGGKDRATATPTAIPTPRPVPRSCDAYDSGIVVSGAPLGAQCQNLNDAGVGNEQVLAAGYSAAVDVWGYVGGGLEVCFEGSGAIVLLDAATSPRSLVSLSAYAARGLNCAWIDRAGAVILMSPQAPSVVAAAEQTDEQAVEQTDEKALQGCMVTTLHVLNFRDGPAGTIFSVISSGLTLTATKRTPDWFEVDLHGNVGWISAHHVTTAGNCA